MTNKENRRSNARFAIFLGAAFAVSLFVGMIIGREPATDSRKQALDQVATGYKFKLSGQLNQDTLNLSIIDIEGFDNSTEVSVRVCRTYWKTDRFDGHTGEYWICYLEKGGTIREWTRPQAINVADNVFHNSLYSHQEKMSRLGAGFDVGKINGSIEIHAVVPGGGFSDEIRIAKPLRDTYEQAPPYLEIGKSYFLLKEIPLVRNWNATDALDALVGMFNLPVGSEVTFETKRSVFGADGYLVSVTGPLGDKEKGWINAGVFVSGEKILGR